MFEVWNFFLLSFVFVVELLILFLHWLRFPNFVLLPMSSCSLLNFIVKVILKSLEVYRFTFFRVIRALLVFFRVMFT